MKRAIGFIALFLMFLAAKPAAAANTHMLVESNLNAPTMNLVCLLRGCQVVSSTPTTSGNLFILSTPSSVNTNFLASILQAIPGILKVQILNGGSGISSNRYIVRTTGGLLNLNGLLCLLNLCSILEPLDGAGNQLFLLGGSNQSDPNLIVAILRSLPGILNVELDQTLGLATGEAQSTTPPPALVNSAPMQYYGSTVWTGYVDQPATQIINLAQVQQSFGVTGAGRIIADIDTGVDPNHPVLKPVLLPGYDFTRNQVGGNEMNDLPSGTPAPENPCQNCTPGNVNQHSVAMVDQHSVAMVDGPQYEDFGHGTMVAGVLHLVAPNAMIMPLKAFGSNGTGQLSDILRAIYFAEQNKANVVNMSFDLTTPSNELVTAISTGEKQGIVFAASAGNDGVMEMVYPAGIAGMIGVASTNDQDQRSTFSNYGNQIVWVAAPGEAIVTTYPFGTYAAAWGTSFSAPMVSAEAALLQNLQPNLTQTQAAFNIAQAQLLLAVGMGNGRIDLYRGVGAASLSAGQHH
jgi:Subtilase family